jgi:hypothetical protein
MNTIAVAKECSGARNYRLAFGDTFANLSASTGGETDTYPSRLDTIIADHLHHRAAGSIQDSG